MCIGASNGSDLSTSKSGSEPCLAKMIFLFFTFSLKNEYFGTRNTYRIIFFSFVSDKCFGLCFKNVLVFDHLHAMERTDNRLGIS